MTNVGVVTVPYILNKDQYVFMVQTVLSALGMHHQGNLDLIAIINHFNVDAGDLEWLMRSFDLVERNDRNNLARAWNKGIRAAFARGNDYALVINLDLVFHSQFLANLIAFAKQRPELLVWSGVPWTEQATLQDASLEGSDSGEVHFSCFMIDKKLFEVVGEFDEQFEPAYHEDSDMAYRVRVSGHGMAATPAARYFHVDRVTIMGAMKDKNETLLATLRQQMNHCMDLYEKKWGGLPASEKFKTPYGR